MKPLNELDRNSILSEEVFIEVFEQEDEIYKARLLLSLEERARELGVKTKFTDLVKTYKRVEREIKQNKKRQVNLTENWTNFSGGYASLKCGAWVASDDGIYMQNNNTGTLDVLACYHPILPVERLKNLETKEEQIKIAYKRNSVWEEIIVPKDLVASASRITALSKKGVSVTSENSKYLVRYLSDVENLNEEEISVRYSSSKLGWIGKGFIPYDTEILFDGESRFRQIFESIEERGKYEKWLEHMKQLRSSKRMEISFMMAASFSSVLIELLGGLPFITDLWGETEGGKTVTLMVAASIWADPDESRYIGDFKATDVALEVRADLLNHLPMILDDTSKVSARIREDFEGFVYTLCSGKGKSRSDKELGARRECHWRNAVLTNGERPLNSYVTQGGAMNRILEVECGEKVYADPQYTAELVKKNYGGAGKRFVQALKEIGADRIREIQRGIQQQLYQDEKMQKQSQSLSIVLTADKIATEWIFQDKEYISMEDAKKVLMDRNELSENERCYQYILNEVAINSAKFDPFITTVENWGMIEKGYAVIYNNIFDAICKRGGFSKNAFLSWADKNQLLQTQGGKRSKNKKVEGHQIRCYFLKMEEESLKDAEGEEGFREIYEQEEIPFR